jgi:serine/threonine-protein kinase
MSQTPQPTIAGRYELRRQLATTPAARVYLAQDLELGRPVAIKILGPDLARDPGVVERFKRAATTAASVHHPNIVTIYDSGEDNGAVFVAMEYVDGSSLAETLQSSGRLGVAPTINMGIRVAEALDAAHAAGLVHGSLKPRDVLLGRDGTVKVIDFGTATAGLASLAGPVDTATYAAPEQLQGQAPDARSDLYSLGVLLYQAITGHAPFTGPDAVAITQRKLSDPAIPPSVAATGIPPGFDAIVGRLLERDPSRRYISGGDVEADLVRLGETAQIPLVEPTRAMPTAVAPAPVAAAPPPPPPEKKRSATGWIVAAIIVLVLAVGGLIAWAVTQNDDEKGELAEVPAVVGARAADAARDLKDNGFSSTTVNEPNDQFGVGLVFEQAPLAGTQARKGSVVVLKVSSGPSTTTTSSTSTTTASSTTTSSTTTSTTTTTTAPPTTSST